MTHNLAHPFPSQHTARWLAGRVECPACDAGVILPADEEDEPGYRQEDAAPGSGWLDGREEEDEL